jgi:NAD(P)-dependent dehydrogenase (short-subunit alcohol dehydrogenase family)
MKDLQGKVAVITGAASGIGRAMTDRFIAAGMKIVLADVDEVKLRNVEAELTENGADVFPVTVDVSLGESVEELARKTLEKYGAAHVLCNNAGVAGVGDQWTGPMSV